MCGRVVYDDNEVIRKYLKSKLNVADYDQLTFGSTFNAPPGSFLPIIYNDVLVRKAKIVEWGLVPVWDKERKMKFANARVETVQSKNAFKNAFKNKRCLVPITGYYEWRVEKGVKQPYFIHSTSGNVLSLAGLYDNDSFTIITTAAYGFMKDLHPRMPLVVDPKFWDLWLDDKPLTEEELGEILAKANENVVDLTFYKVDRAVNRIANNRSELTHPIV